MKNHSIILVMALIAAGGASAMETATIASGNDTKQLLGGTIYTVSGDVSVSVGAGKNALEVKHASGDGGNKVVIEIKDGGSLTVTGGDANGRDGAGAGILLPSDMTLYITGKGRLTATGGKAAPIPKSTMTEPTTKGAAKAAVAAMAAAAARPASAETAAWVQAVAPGLRTLLGSIGATARTSRPTEPTAILVPAGRTALLAEMCTFLAMSP